MPYLNRAKARLEHEVTILRREVSDLRAKHEQGRREKVDQAVLQARLEQEIHSLQTDLEEMRIQRQLRECGGDEQSTKMNQHLKKLDEHVVKQERYITFLEKQIDRTRIKYQQRMIDVHKGADQLEGKLMHVRDEMQGIKEQAGEVDQLKKRLACLDAKVVRRNKVIAQFEAQHKEYMKVIGELQKQVGRQSGGDGDVVAKEANICSTSGTDLNIGDIVTENVTSVMPPSAYDPPKPNVSNFACLTTALKIKLDAQ